MYCYPSNLYIMKSLVVKYGSAFLARVTQGHLPPYSAVAAIVELDNHLLIVDRSDGLGYCLPGGIMRWGESIPCALQREVKEETGYDIEILRLLNNYSGSDRDPRVNSVCMAYSARCIGGELTSSEEGTAMWLPYGEWCYQKFAFDHREILKDYFSQQLFMRCAVMQRSLWIARREV